MIENKFYKEIPIFKMEIFVKFCQLQTLSKTGRAIGLTPADVNNIILGIEKNIGGPVYVRKMDQFTLTEKGEELLAFCTVILDAMENLDVKEINNKQPNLVIGVTAWSAINFLPKIIEKFNEIHNDVCLKVLVGAEHTKFLDQECDIALGLPLSDIPEIHQRLLTECTVKLYATREYLEKNGIPQSITDLKKHKILTHLSLPPLPESSFVNNQCSVSSNSFLPLIEFVLQNRGIALLDKLTLTTDERCVKLLVEVLPDFEAHRYPFMFLNRRNSEKSNMIETLFNLSVEQAKQNEGF